MCGAFPPLKITSQVEVDEGGRQGHGPGGPIVQPTPNWRLDHSRAPPRRRPNHGTAHQGRPQSGPLVAVLPPVGSLVPWPNLPGTWGESSNTPRSRPTCACSRGVHAIHVAVAAGGFGLHVRRAVRPCLLACVLLCTSLRSGSRCASARGGEKGAMLAPPFVSACVAMDRVCCAGGGGRWPCAPLFERQQAKKSNATTRRGRMQWLHPKQKPRGPHQKISTLHHKD